MIRVLLLAAVVGTVAAGAEAGDEPQFRVATFECDVTLPLGDLLYSDPLTTIEHPLLAKGVVLDDAGKRYVLCAVDWCTLRNAAHRTFQSKVAAAAGADASHVAIHCVHQHTAPSFDASAEQLLEQQKNPPPHRNLESLETITDRLARAVKASLGQLEPFDSVGIGRARVDRVASARRLFTDDGKLRTRWSACKDPVLRAMPEGDIDPVLKTVTLARGPKPLVRIHYYATHPQSFYRDGRASYDFPGMARERLQRNEEVFQIYFTGCAGDVTAGKYNDGSRKARAELAERLFAGMQASVASTRYAPVDRIVWRTLGVQLDPRSDARYDVTAQRATLANPQADADARAQAASRIACVERLRKPIDLSAVVIGPATILHLPGEPMNAYQHFAQDLLPDRFVAVAGYGIGTPGYVCTESAFEEGGYEPSASAIVPQSEKALKTAIRQLLVAE
jgi:hypothetical protein